MKARRSTLHSLFLAYSCFASISCGGSGSDSFNAGDEVGKICGGIQGALCSEGLYCQFPVNSCGARNTTGLCQLLPAGCPVDINPVCGCDGNLYSNACEASRAGQSIRPIVDCTED